MSTAEIIAELPRLSSTEFALVQAKIRELIEPARAQTQNKQAADHPAVGIWKNRKDLPDDSIEASNVLREQMIRRNDAKPDATKS